MTGGAALYGRDYTNAYLCVMRAEIATRVADGRLSPADGAMAVHKSINAAIAYERHNAPPT